MSRTKRTGTAQRIVPLLVGAAVAVTSVILLSGSPATASAKTVTVSFTADGPSPASVTLNPGDTVVYRNDVNPNDQTLVGAVGGAVRTVNVSVTNAAQQAFTLSAGKSRSLTYESPVSTTYAADYQPTMLLGLVPGKTVVMNGTVTVKDDSGDTPPAVPAPPAKTGGSAPPPQTSGSSASQQPADQQNPDADNGQDGQSDQSQNGQPSDAGQPSVNYTPPAGDPAAGTVPSAGASSTPTAAAGGGTDTDKSDSATVSPDDGATTKLPEIGDAQNQANVTHASSEGSTDSLGLPAIMAVVLLSMVSAGLVRMIMVRQAHMA